MKKLASFSLALYFLLCGDSSLRAEDFVGTYHEVNSGTSLEVEKTGEDQFTIKCTDWTSILFWNKQTQKYEGVFRYNNSTSELSKQYGKGGQYENAAGYHSIISKGNGFYEVTFQWGLSPEAGHGTYLIKKQ